jgi:hypothetical protein
MIPSKPKTGKPFVYRFVFYHEDDIERARQQGHEALTDLRIRDTYLKLKSAQMGVPLVIAKKDPRNLGAKTRIGDWSIIDQDDFAQIPTSRILEEIKAYRADVRREKMEARSKVLAIARREREALVWHRPVKLMDRFVLKGTELHEVRCRTVDGDYQTDVSPYPVASNTIQHNGQRHTVAYIRWMLSNGAIPHRVKGGRVKGSGKPRYKAQIRIGSQVKHLGMFDSPEDRDHAVRVARVNLLLGLSVYPSP